MEAVGLKLPVGAACRVLLHGGSEVEAEVVAKTNVGDDGYIAHVEAAVRGAAPNPQGNRVQEVSEITMGLKAIAKELDIPVLALSQLSRAVEGRQSHVPMLSDLRESGSLEQDSDNVWFLYREELHDPNTDKKGIAELHVAKHRQGPVGVIPMRFDAATTRFDTLTYREPDGY